MHRLEGIFLWAAVAFYVGALVASLVGWIFRRPRVERAALLGGLAAVALHLAAAVTRWIVTGHAPVMAAYENSLAGSWFVAVIFAVLAWRFPATRRALPFVGLAVLLMIGNGLTAPAQLKPLEPPYRSGWLVVHVTFAWVAFGSFLVASVLAGLHLRALRRPGPEAAKRAALLDDIGGRLIALGFAGDTVMIASGAIWAHGLWGRYWGWDPVETWSLITWIIYGVNLHLRFTMGWRGRKAAWLALLSVLTVLITFFGIRVVSDVHTQLLR